MKKRMIILLTIIVLAGCAAERTDEPKIILGQLKVGEAVYVCGCPLMCCNSISRNPGRCVCNAPMRRGTITMNKDGKIHVSVSGREKVLFIAKR